MNFALLLLVTSVSWQAASTAAAFKEAKTPRNQVRKTDEKARLNQARQLISRGFVAEAIEQLRPLAQEYPQSVEVHLALGSALALVPQRAEALAEIETAIQINSDSAAAYHTLGVVLGRFAEPEAARQAFEKAIELDPELSDARVNLALVLAQRQEFAVAERELRQAVKILGNTTAAAYPHYLLGKIHNELDRPNDAAQDFERAIRLRPDYAEAHLALGLTHRKLLNGPAALRALEKAVKLDPKNSSVHYRVGVEYLQAGKAAQASEHLRQAARSMPEDRPVLYSLARALRSSGQVDEAAQVEQQLRQLIGTADKARTHAIQATQYNNEGVELEKSGKLAAALEKYQAALDLDPFHGGFRRNLGLCFCRMGQWDRGIAELREVLRQNPNDEETTKALYIAVEQAARAQGGKKP